MSIEPLEKIKHYKEPGRLESGYISEREEREIFGSGNLSKCHSLEMNVRKN